MLLKIKKFKKIIVKENLSIEKSIEILQKQGLQILLVVDKNYNYLGTVTDGDIRRSLLKKKTIKDKIAFCVNKNSITISKNLPEVFILELMKKNFLNSLPIVKNNKIIGLYKLKENITNKKLKENIVVMAGGKGKRLLPLTKTVPKGMIKIDQKPILEHIIINGINYGFVNFIFSVNYLSYKIKNYFGNGYKDIASIKYINEKKPLGTAGSLSLLNLKNNENFILMNCDIYTGLNLNKLLKYHKKNNADITVVGKLSSRTSDYGILISNGKKLNSIEEKLTYSELINTGVYVIKASSLSLLKKNYKTDMNDFLLKIKKYKKVIVYPIYEYWYDIGKISTLKKVNKIYKNNV